jgi:hypothetical protein
MTSDGHCSYVPLLSFISHLCRALQFWPCRGMMLLMGSDTRYEKHTPCNDTRYRSHYTSLPLLEFYTSLDSQGMHQRLSLHTCHHVMSFESTHTHSSTEIMQLRSSKLKIAQRKRRRKKREFRKEVSYRWHPSPRLKNRQGNETLPASPPSH